MNTPILLGIDVGTSATKALAIDPAGNALGVASRDYALSSPRPRWSEQDPEDWWTATCGAIRAIIDEGIDPDRVAGVGLAGQMHGLVLLDANGAVVRPAILWNDQRTTAESDAIHARVGRETVERITGKPALPNFTAPKVLWVREHEPDSYARAARLLLPKDFVRFRLTGAAQIDVADASGTALFDVGGRAWSDAMVDALHVPRAWLPEIHESPVPAATVSSAGAAATGLRRGTPVVAGAGDQAAEAVGCGIVEEGVVSVTIGTSGVVFAATETYDPTSRLHAYCHAVPGMWHVMGVMLSAGGALAWHQSCFDRPLETLLAEAAAVPAGSGGLLFLPYLAGERTPHADALARGAFVGLTLRHTRGHLTRAVLEGVAFGLLDSIGLVRDQGVAVERVRVSGGGAKSPLWRQILADAFGTDVVTVNVSQGAAYGAALLAAVGAGVHADVRAAAAVVREVETTTPGPHAAVTQRVAARYRALYPALREQFPPLAAIDEAATSTES